MREYAKCNFCRYYDSYDGCENICNNYSEFSVSYQKIIDKAKEAGITVADVVALINLTE